MLAIRLTRFGKKKRAFYRIVVADSRSAVSGKYIEKIGHYNPLLDPPEIFVEKEKVKRWLTLGAKPSDTVWNLLVEAGVLKKKIVTQRKRKKKEKKEIEEKPMVAKAIPKEQEAEKETKAETKEETEQEIGKNSSSKNLSGRSASKNS